MSNLKAGDMVYSPTEGSQVFEVVWRNNVKTYQIGVGRQTFSVNGMAFAGQVQPSIFHATKENQALLEALYGVKFDDPPLSDKEKVIEALKNANGKPVPCVVWADSYDVWLIRPVMAYEPTRGFCSTDILCWYSNVKPLSPDEFVLA